MNKWNLIRNALKFYAIFFHTSQLREVVVNSIPYINELGFNLLTNYFIMCFKTLINTYLNQITTCIMDWEDFCCCCCFVFAAD